MSAVTPPRPTPLPKLHPLVACHSRACTEHGDRSKGSTAAALRAVRDAISFNSIPGVALSVPGGRENMLVHVKLGVPPQFSEVDLDEVARVFPYGRLLPTENLIRATHDPCGGKFELGAFSTPNQASSCSSCLRASSEKTKFVDKHLGGGESWRAAPRCHCSAPALSPPLEYLNPTFSSSCLSVQCRCTSTTTRPLFAV